MKQWIVDRGSLQNRIAVVEDGLLTELYLYRTDDLLNVGAVCVGRVANVVPDLGAAFVDIGDQKNAFLHEDDSQTEAAQAQGGPRPIGQTTKAGKMIMVQIKHPSSGSKGAQVTRKISIPGRWTVLLPQSTELRFSRKIQNKAWKQEAKKLVKEALGNDFGAIIRTESEQVAPERIRLELETLVASYRAMEQAANIAMKPRRLDNPFYVEDALQQRLSNLPDVIVFGDKSLKAPLETALGHLGLQEEVDLDFQKVAIPIFESHGVEEQVYQAMGRYHKLKSGGQLVIDQTEAMTVVDVNTAKGSNKAGIRKQTNREALATLSRLMKLRNTGGMVLLDLIDLPDTEKDRIVKEAKDVLESDRRVRVHGLTRLSLLEITRRRAGDSVMSAMTESCSACLGSGVEPVAAMEVERLLKRIARMTDHTVTQAMAIEVAHGVGDLLMADKSKLLARVKADHGVTCYLRRVSRLEKGSFYIAASGSLEKVEKYMQKNWQSPE